MCLRANAKAKRRCKVAPIRLKLGYNPGMGELDDPLLDYERQQIAKALPTARIEIYFREVTRKLPKFGKDRNGSPDKYKDGKWFYVELHARELVGWWGPLGIGVAQVTEYRPYLYSVLVLGTVRQFGLGTRIVEAAGGALAQFLLGW